MVQTWPTYLSDVKFVAETTTSSTDWTRTGIFLHPGDFKILCNICKVSWRMFGGHMSILVTTTNTGTPRARAKPRCSFVIPITPALAPTYKHYGVMHLQTHTCTHTQTHTYTHAHTHSHVHVHAIVFIHTCTWTQRGGDTYVNISYHLHTKVWWGRWARYVNIFYH